MTSTTDLRSDATPASASWWTGRSELLVAAIVAALATFLLVGTVTMDVPAAAGSPGPQFFPAVVSGLLYVLAVVLAVTVIRAPRVLDTSRSASAAQTSRDMLSDFGGIDATSEIRVVREQEKGAAPRTQTDWRTVGLVVGALILFALLLEPLGWILTAAGLFWAVCYALGSKRQLFDISVAILFSSAVQVAFSAGLGLNLPAGILAGVTSWIS